MAIKDYEGECPFCKKEFFKKRINQVYCTRWCQYTNHNDKQRLKAKKQNNIFKILKQNDRIIENLCWQYRNLIPKEIMDHEGFNYEVISTCDVNEEGKIISFSLINYKLKLIKGKSYLIKKI